jgi:hypothetical protein
MIPSIEPDPNLSVLAIVPAQLDMQPAGHGADDGVPIVVPLKNSGIQEAEKEVVNQSAH